MKKHAVLLLVFLLSILLLFAGCRKSTPTDTGWMTDPNTDIPVAEIGDDEKDKEDSIIDDIFPGDKTNPDMDHPTTDPHEATLPDDTGTQPPRYFKVIFTSDLANFFADFEVEEGQDATPPDPPEVEGYRFVSWDKDYTNVHSQLIVSAEYELMPPDDIARLKFSEPENDTCSLIGIGIYKSSTLKLPLKSPDGYDVVSVAENAFKGNKTIDTLVIPAGITLEDGCFANSALTTIVIDGINSLKDLSDNEDLYISELAFYGSCGIHELVFGDEITDLEIAPLSWLKAIRYSIVSVTLSSSVTSIEDGFFNYFVKLVQIKNNSDFEIEMGSTENGGIGLHLLDYPEDTDYEIVKYGNYLFYVNEYMEKYYLLGSVASAAADGGLLVLPEGYRGESHYYTIHPFAFAFREDITEVVIPGEVEAVEKGAFAGCSKLERVAFAAKTPMGKTAFYRSSGFDLLIDDTLYTYNNDPAASGNHYRYVDGTPSTQSGESEGKDGILDDDSATTTTPEVLTHAFWNELTPLRPDEDDEEE